MAAFALRTWSRRHAGIAIGGTLLVLIALLAIFAPWAGTADPMTIAPAKRLRPPSAEFWFGSDMLGRDLYSRVIYGARVSLVIGIGVAVFSAVVGLAIGLVTG